MDVDQKIDWLVKHVKYTQALCEIILENLPKQEKSKMIALAKARVKEIS